MKINQRGYWENETDEGHGHDERLAKSIIKFFYSERKNYKDADLYIIDIGCGDGYYTDKLVRHGFNCVGYDGNPNTFDISSKKYGTACYEMDFTRDYVQYELDKDYSDWGLCLEVGEHIPIEYEQIFLNNLNLLISDGIILSWAVEGQGGDGHVNCRNNDYIISEMEKRGFEFDAVATFFMRADCAEYPNNGWWFRQSLMIFRRIK